MVSLRLGTLVMTATPMLLITGKAKAATKVVISGTTPIDIIIRVMDGTKVHSMVKRVRIGGRNNHTLATSPNNPMAINTHHIVVMTITMDVPTITPLLPCLHYLAL